ncbi:Fc.00g018880.m01.CDS01 [Cosmosporella sp. VM-42]
MQTPKNAVALATTLLTLLASSVSAHSWVEYAYKLAPNGTMVGEIGFARGFVPRNSTDPVFSDSIPVNILPVAGQGSYSGSEILNKFKYEADPQFPMLEAAAGDYVAIMHLENGHTTLPGNQPLKPLNRGTVYFYGTTKPKENEKLFDVHLLWNKDGSGGDGRGKLLATRNYDDGQCYQPNPSELSTERATKLAAYGAEHNQELACQSDIKLPTDLKEGDVYTIYWYWDWPDLNKEKIDFDATKDGKYPWAGTFMRGDKDPNGFTMAAIAKNESYSSVIDIKITGNEAASFAAKDKVGLEFVQNQDIYSMGIKEQMKSNFQVDVDGGAGSGDGGAASTSAALITTPLTTTAASGGSDGGVATVTVTMTVQPPPLVTTVYVTGPPATAASPTSPTSTKTKTIFYTRPHESAADSSAIEQSPSTVVMTVTTHVSHASSSAVPEAESPSSVQTTSTMYLTLTSHRSHEPSSTALLATDSALPVAEPSSSTQSTSTYVMTLTEHVSHTLTSLASVITVSSAAPVEPSASPQTTSTYVMTLTSHVSHSPSSVAPAESASSVSYPGGQFRETPVTTTNAPTPTGPSTGPPTPSGFLRRRGNWAFGAF